MIRIPGFIDKATREAARLEEQKRAGLTTIQAAAKAYPDLWHRWLNLVFGYVPKSVVLSVEQAEEFIALTKLEEFQ